MVEPLADITDVAAILGRDLTPDEEARVDAILVKASQLFRSYAGGQQFTPGNSTVTLTVRTGGTVLLPQRPVTAVTAVTTVDGASVDAIWAGQRLTVSPALAGGILQVTYTHGGAIPDLVRWTVADVAQKALTIPAPAQAGVQQSTTTRGPFTESFTYAQWALGGQASFSPADIAVAKSFRPTPLGTINVR